MLIRFSVRKWDIAVGVLILLIAILCALLIVAKARIFSWQEQEAERVKHAVKAERTTSTVKAERATTTLVLPNGLRQPILRFPLHGCDFEGIEGTDGRLVTAWHSPGCRRHNAGPPLTCSP